MGKPKIDEKKDAVKKENTVDEQETTEKGFPSFFEAHDPKQDLQNLRGQHRKMQKSARE